MLKRMDRELRDVFPELLVLDLTDLARSRQTIFELLAAANQGVERSPNVVVSDHFAPGWKGAPEVKVRRYAPVDQADELPCLYWIHGGGHVQGSIDQDDPVMSRIVEDVGCVVLSVEWRHAPEHPFPASLDDCYAGLTWSVDHAADLLVDPERIVIGGASSGGGSAAGLALRLRDEGGPAVILQLLVYPMLDDRNETPSSFEINDPRVWNRGSNLIAWRHYLGDAVGSDAVSPYAAPARATELEGLPPAFVAVGDLDLFLDEDLTYAQRLLQQGVPVELHVYAGAFHGFDLLDPEAGISRRMIRDRDDALRRAFASS